VLAEPVARPRRWVNSASSKRRKLPVKAAYLARRRDCSPSQLWKPYGIMRQLQPSHSIFSSTTSQRFLSIVCYPVRHRGMIYPAQRVSKPDIFIVRLLCWVAENVAKDVTIVCDRVLTQTAFKTVVKVINGKTRGLAWSGLVWSVVACFGLAWSSLVWSASSCMYP
jgi:hypothetical protein